LFSVSVQQLVLTLPRNVRRLIKFEVRVTAYYIGKIKSVFGRLPLSVETVINKCMIDDPCTIFKEFWMEYTLWCTVEIADSVVKSAKRKVVLKLRILLL